MPGHIRLLTAIAFTSLALAPAASAHDWQGPWNGSGPQTQTGDPNWSPPNWNPTQGSGAPSYPSPGWTPSQGDPQGTPPVWTNRPSVQQPSQNHGSNPWSNIPALPVSKTPTVAGKTAMIRRNGLAAIPRSAPAAVRRILVAANQIIGKPYKWGGGHGRLFDSGYDCSGSVSYALIRAGLLSYPMVSGTLAHWGLRGAGTYVTIYANKSHVYMEVAGLRLDTSSVGDPSGKDGVRWRPPIGGRFGFAVRHVAGL